MHTGTLIAAAAGKARTTRKTSEDKGTEEFIAEATGKARTTREMS